MAETILNDTILNYVLFFSGILGLIILYMVLAHLSARMGEGMGISGYYRLYYIAILALVTAVGWSVYFPQEENSLVVLFGLLITGNAVAIAASFRYWWWLKRELLNENK